MELAVEFDVLVRPQCLHHPYLFGRALAAVVEILVEATEFDLVPADADAQAESPATQHVERGRLLRHQHRLPLCQDQYANGKANTLSATGEEAEQHEWIVIRAGRRPDTPPAVIGRRIGAKHMVRCDQVV